VPDGEYPQLPRDTSLFTYQWYQDCKLLEDETNHVRIIRLCFFGNNELSNLCMTYYLLYIKLFQELKKLNYLLKCE